MNARKLLRSSSISISHKILFAILAVSSVLTVLSTVIQLRRDYKEDIGAVERNFDLI